MATAPNKNKATSSKQGCRKKVRNDDNDNVDHNFAEYLKEGHKQPIYSVEFCYFLKPNEPVIFATVGSNIITIYECKVDEIILLDSYSDPNKTEQFFTCCWSYDLKTSEVVLAAAGFYGIIRIIYPTNNMASMSLSGHCESVLDLKFHPKMPYILLSAGKDHSVRMWNIQSNVCICIFGGVKGHTDQVLSIDFDTEGDRIISGGLDYCIRIWRLDVSPIKKKIEESIAFIAERGAGDDRLFPTFTQHYPDFSTQDVHSNIVDCVKWLGNLILSKSLTNSIICWKPGLLRETSIKTTSISAIHQFDIDDCGTYWYIRFALDISKKYMALGNEVGTIYLWSLQSDDPTQCKRIVLKHKKCKSTIRDIAFSRDNKILISVCDDSTVWRWNISDVTN